MQAIKLNDKQKENLLEMCKVLFPDMFFAFSSIPTVGVGENDLYYYETERSRKRKYVHWFEFVMTYLRMKLKLHHDDMFCTMNPGVNTFKHPVDYLYEQYLKFKL